MTAALDEVHGGINVEPSTHIANLMHERIRRYLDARSDPSLYQSLRNMSQFVSDDYGNRFLIELIQNAHDAHDPSGTDGEIAIVLDASEDAHGCLYVANRGKGFIGDNLRAITNIALSSKPVNAGIGNKGLGFRSVLQVCKRPEIYSVDGIGGRGVFDGYCFRFATVDDLADVLGAGSAELVGEMSQNLPCWHLPVPTIPGPNVARFAGEGFATVVRLPLKSDDALRSVRAQIDSLLGLKAPLPVTIEWRKKDRYGRTVGKVIVNGVDANLKMVEAGLAWHFKQYAREQSPADRARYDKAEEDARAKGVGLWRDRQPVPPWEFRKKPANVA